SFSILQKAAIIPDKNIVILKKSSIRIESEIKSTTSNEKYRVILDVNSGVNCSCIYWSLKARKRMKLCKHIVKLIEFISNNLTQDDYRMVILRALQPDNIIYELLSEGFIVLDNGKVKPTKKGELCLLTSIHPDLLNNIIKLLRESKLELNLKFLKILETLIFESLFELPYSPSDCV
ncbi:MAG: hypothetical protein ACTSYQ_01150, partial [Candidatus Odinarchaeia archaeon]